jgi:phenylpropionate dioxygenase-like ring-hydroxylating dioxygenase large terminal subunit
VAHRIEENGMSYDPRSLGYSVLNEAPKTDARHKPGHVYTSPEVYELEKERIFKTDWLNVGQLDEIPNTGDYLTLRIADEPALVVRIEGGEVVTLANVWPIAG